MAQKAQDSRRGIVLMISGVFLFGIMEVMVKILAENYEIIQIVWARFLFHFLIFIALFSRSGLRGIGKTGRPGLHVARSFLLLSATTFFFIALSHLPLADATSIGFVSPLLVTAFAIPFLGEKVGPRRWAAILVGLVGVLIIIRPGLGVMHWAASLPLTRSTRKRSSPIVPNWLHWLPVVQANLSLSPWAKAVA